MGTDAAVTALAVLLAITGSGCRFLLAELRAPAEIRAAQDRERQAATVQADQREAEGEVGGELIERDRIERDLAALERHLMLASCGAEVEDATVDALARMRLAEAERGRFYLCTAAAQPPTADVAGRSCLLTLASGGVGTIASCGAAVSERCGTAPPPLPTWPEVGNEEIAARGMSSPPPCFVAAQRTRAQ